jgi:hypothetical protein
MLRYLMLLSFLVGCTETVTVHAIGECPDGASVYNTDPARWQIRLCSFSGEPEDGICLQKGPDVVCAPLCNNGGASLCDASEQFQTFDQVCYCEVI